ncbi:MAG: transporter [Kiritimatiellia bacterium]
MKKFVLCAVAALTAGAVLAESEFNRPYFTRENRHPDAGAWEAGVFSEYSKIDESGNNKWADWERKEFTAGVYARYGLLENLTAYGKLPFGHVDSDINDKHTGIRDISLGLELFAYEYTFEYPYVIPYVELTLATGDDKYNLGRGETDFAFGTSIGTTVYEVYHYVLDGRYNVNYNDDGVFSLAASFIWDLSYKFSLMAEAKGTSEDIPGESGAPVYFRGGMYYRATDQLCLAWYGGGAINSNEKGMGAIRAAYLF